MSSVLMPQAVQESDVTLDANSILTDLDKGLRSIRPGEQCEAIVRFPALLERYPFPILVNSASLKLADVFRTGSNFSRLLILRVITQSQKHLDKIGNSDEFIRRIFSVSYSNDPVARALTLKTLAAVATIASERKNIHHLVRDSLDSQDEIEVTAAIEAAASYAYQCKEFALNIYPKVLSMIHQSIDARQKTNLLSVLLHKHYDPLLAREVSLQCINLLSSNESEKFVCSALKTLSFVSSSAFSLVSSNITLLLKFLRDDCRSQVRMQALEEMQSLAELSPHLWSPTNFAGLICAAEDAMSANNSNIFVTTIMSTICFMVKCPCLLTSHPEEKRQLLDRTASLCLSIMYNPSSDMSRISLSCQILASLSVSHEGDGIGSLEQLVCCIQSLMLSLSTGSDTNDVSRVRLCQTCVFLSHRDSCIRERMVSIFRIALLSPSLPKDWLKHITQTLCAINDTQQRDEEEFSVQLVGLLKGNSNLSDSLLLNLLTLYFQTVMVSNQDSRLDMHSLLEGRSLWLCYQVARQAIRFGLFSICQDLCDKIQVASCSDPVIYWMRCLSKVAAAESGLTNFKDPLSLDCRLSRAIGLYVEASSALKNVVTFGHPLAFQTQYLQLRLESLQGLENLRQSCKLVRTSPAPAVAAQTAISSRDDLLKYGSIVTQMRRSAKEFRVLSESYSRLFQSSFNADNQTLAHIQLLQNSCTMIAEAVESLFQTNRLSSLIVDKNTHLEETNFDSKGPSIEHTKLIKTCRSISEAVTQQLTPRNSARIEYSHIAILEDMTEKLLSVPLSIPRLFFQAVQTVSLKLALSPQPKAPGEFVLVLSSHNFALKTEGVVVSGGRRQRKVSKVLLNVTCSPTTVKTQETKMIDNKTAEVNLSCIVVPKNDYFQTQFLINFQSPGSHTVSVEASIIDDNDAQWKTGPVLTTNIKVVEDTVK